MSTVFVYGSLMAPEVLRALLGRVPPARSATLAGYRRSALRERSYPAAVLGCTGDAVRGQVLLELSAREQRVLDAFEGEEYASASVEVLLEVYLFLQPALMLQSEWSYEHWRRTHLVDFERSCVEWGQMSLRRTSVCHSTTPHPELGGIPSSPD